MPAVLAGAVIAQVMRAAAGAGMRGALPCLRAPAAVPPAVAAPVRAEPLVSFLWRLDDQGAAGAAVLDAVPACRDPVPAAERLDRPDGQAGGSTDIRVAFPRAAQARNSRPLSFCHVYTPFRRRGCRAHICSSRPRVSCVGPAGYQPVSGSCGPEASWQDRIVWVGSEAFILQRPAAYP